ncbi:MAG TPA: peptide-methionine (S)-S-oxide reductase MsrA [Candidatus Saccharimonadales bacterium]|nr:peptide-methionine (S)-S-oxide reductase MsrA [Candidatus Saccharimonadales bacterium]
MKYGEGSFTGSRDGGDETAIFAAGCFWGVQDYFDQIPGVLKTEVGYTGGHTDLPTYEMVLTHTTGHAEAVRVTFDPSKVSYGTLLKQFFRMHDPTQLNRQGPDIGDNYRSAIFYSGEDQKKAAEKAIEELNKSGRYKKPIATTLEPAGKWWRAEDYHQKFVQKTGRGACHVEYSPI